MERYGDELYIGCGYSNLVEGKEKIRHVLYLHKNFTIGNELSRDEILEKLHDINITGDLTLHSHSLDLFNTTLLERCDIYVIKKISSNLIDNHMFGYIRLIDLLTYSNRYIQRNITAMHNVHKMLIADRFDFKSHLNNIDDDPMVDKINNMFSTLLNNTIVNDKETKKPIKWVDHKLLIDDVERVLYEHVSKLVPDSYVIKKSGIKIANMGKLYYNDTLSVWFDIKNSDKNLLTKYVSKDVLTAAINNGHETVLATILVSDLEKYMKESTSKNKLL